MGTVPTIIKTISAPYGNMFDPVKVSVEPAKRKGAPKECFKNSAMYVLGHSTAKYCLGYYLMRGAIPIEHAWVHDGEKYLELTMLDIGEKDEYYMFTEFDFDELLKVLKFTKRVPPTFYETFKYYKHGKKT